MAVQTTASTWALASVTEQRQALRAGHVTSRELVEGYFDRIKRFNPGINALVGVDEQGALEAADRADAALSRGEEFGPLHGIPFSVKDAIGTATMPTTAGAVELKDHIYGVDAVVVAKLRAQGAILIGKSNLPTWSGNIQTNNELFGLTINPWNPAHTPGGSSGGSAAAVSAGLTSFEVGSDLGGSIRIPAHFCGIAGHRPSEGIVSQLGYIDHVGGGSQGTDINVLGPLARSVSDLRVLVETMAGPDPALGDAWSIDLPSPRSVVPSEWNIALWVDPDMGPETSDPIKQQIVATVAGLRRHGATVTETTPDVDLDLARSLCRELIASAIVPSRVEQARGTEANDHGRWLANKEKLDAVNQQWRAWFKEIDVLLAPVMSVPAFEHILEGGIGDLTLEVDGEDISHRDLAHQWNGPAGVVGLPSTTVPIGISDQGLPIGMQVIAPHLHDLTALSVAEFIETLRGRFTPPSYA